MSKLIKSVNQLIFNHDSYRIQVTFKSGNAKQYIKAFEEIAYPYLDFYQDQLNFDTWINKKRILIYLTIMINCIDFIF